MNNSQSIEDHHPAGVRFIKDQQWGRGGSDIGLVTMGRLTPHAGVPLQLSPETDQPFDLSMQSHRCREADNLTAWQVNHSRPAVDGCLKSWSPIVTHTLLAETRKTHPIYKKQYTVTTKFMAHDEKNEAHEGDKVVIAESKPISARKRFTLVEVIEKANVKVVEATVDLPEKDKPSVKPAAKKAEKPVAEEAEAK